MDATPPHLPMKRPRETIVDSAIHSLHRSLEDRMKTAARTATLSQEKNDQNGLGREKSSGVETVVETWCSVWATVADTNEMATYAHAMDELFSKCQESTTLVIELVKRYFFSGAVGAGATVVCERGATALKQLRRDFFQTVGRVMNSEELAQATVEVQDEYSAVGRLVSILDVGSCHGALQTLVDNDRDLASILEVISLDLCPSRPHVVQADWLTYSVDEGSTDVVLMCYMLSFLPDGYLRWHACHKAAVTLAPGGLFIIMEPKRGVRRSKWGHRWAQILKLTLGFHFVREEQRTHTVVLLFSKPVSGMNITNSFEALNFHD